MSRTTPSSNRPRRGALGGAGLALIAPPCTATNRKVYATYSLPLPVRLG